MYTARHIGFVAAEISFLTSGNNRQLGGQLAVSLIVIPQKIPNWKIEETWSELMAQFFAIESKVTIEKTTKC